MFLPENLDRCVREVMSKGHDESSAYAICHEAMGKIKDVSKTGEIATFEDNGRLYLKAFLLDSSLSLNDWGVTKASLRENINSFIGKPLVLTAEYDHPVPRQNDSLQHWLAFQEDFRIGTIIDIVPQNSAYYAIIEITDPDAKRAFQMGSIPNYVSPAIAQPMDEPADAITNWIGVHLAIVDDPAFTVKKATIISSCGGDSDQCLLQLRKAKKERGCGFCNYKALISKFPFSSQASSGTQFKTGKMVEPVQQSTDNNNNTTAVVGTSEETVPKSQYLELEKKLADSELKNRELSEVNKTISDRVATLEQKDRQREIDSFMNMDLAKALGKDEKWLEEKTKAYLASNIPLSDIKDIYKDIPITVVRKASVERPTRPHVTIGNNDNNSEEKAETGRKLAMTAGII